MSTAELDVLTALRIDSSRGSSSERLADSLAAVNDEVLVERAEKEGVAGILYRETRRRGLEASLEPSALERLQAFYRRTAALNLQRQRDLGEILDACAPQGAKIVVLKGMSLLDSLYDDPGERPMSDVDLWIERRDLDQLGAALRRLGYEEQPFYPETFHRGSTVVEIHTDLLGASRIRSRGLILAGEHARIFERTEAFAACGAPTWRLERHDAVVFACLHLLKHNASRLLWLLEIEALIQPFNEDDWSEVLERADAAGQRRALHQVAFLAGDLLSPAGSSAREPAPTSNFPASLADGAPLGRLERRALALRRARGALPAWGPLLFFSAQRSFRERATSIFETLFPRPTVLRQIFEDRTSSIATLYFKRFWQLLEMLVRH